jgi:hypothetical protein
MFRSAIGDELSSMAGVGNEGPASHFPRATFAQAQITAKPKWSTGRLTFSLPFPVHGFADEPDQWEWDRE